MPFDGKVSDYFETKHAPVYDRDNPPPTMAEAIRMAVADVEALLDKGFRYSWGHPNFIPPNWGNKFGYKPADVCVCCTAGSVVIRFFSYDVKTVQLWQEQPGDWPKILAALSDLTQPNLDDNVLQAAAIWPEGMPRRFPHYAQITDAGKDPAAFKRDMLALADRLEAEAV